LPPPHAMELAWRNPPAPAHAAFPGCKSTRKMCACSNTGASIAHIFGCAFNVMINKSTDIVQGFQVRTDSNP
jgi:hypothetical protein